MSLTTFTLLHVLISLIGIVVGLIAMTGWLKSDPSRIPTAIFLATTILTSVTGFLFPFTKLLPSHIVGIISLVMLALATFASTPDVFQAFGVRSIRSPPCYRFT